ncbi:MAG: penicillin-binding transpeptidase domain-containing protein [Clostridia bacterium]
MARVSVKAKNRIVRMFVAYILLMCIVVGALVYYQLIKGEEYKEKAAEQQTQDQKVEAKRGSIYDRNMKVLAQSASCEDVMINPRQIKSTAKAQEKRRIAAESEGKAFKEEDVIEKIVKNLTELLEVDEQWLREEIEADYASRRIKKKVDQSVVNSIRALDLPGVFFVESTKRYYPYSSFASHIIGFTGDDGNGLEGLEKTLNSTLAGTAGRIQVVKDVHNNDTPYEYENYIAPEDGKGVVLTIDEVLQHYVEKYLEEVYTLHKVQKGAAAIMMDAKTGEILAMAVEPNFDLNNPRYVDADLKELVMGGTKEDGSEYTDYEFLTKLWRNKAVCDTYEPGSTFKSIVAASAVESGVVNPATDTFVCTGSKRVSVHTIRCHKRSGHGAETFYQALENSCNPAFMEMGARLGYKKFREYFEAFGFMDETGFVLPGESKGIFFSPNNFNEAELATSSFGQGFSITPLQMITAFSAVVNGGNLMKPQLIKAYTDNEGNIIENVEPELVRKVISESTSSVMRAALEGVVATGTGKTAYVEGYRIGGKTGTSEKLPRGQGKYVASFIGFAPADDPQIVCLMLLDEPGAGQTGGSAVAAPAVAKILTDSLKYLGYEPELSDSGAELTYVPSVIDKSVSEATKLCKEAGLEVTISGNGQVIKNQLPKANTKRLKGSPVVLYTDVTEDVKVEMPNFLYMTKAEVEKAAKDAGLGLVITGGGATGVVTDDMVAVDQGTAAGEVVVVGSVVTVHFADNIVEGQDMIE